MKPSKFSLFYHICGLIVFLIGFVSYLLTAKNEPLLMGLAGLTLIWLVALEKDVYELK